MQRKLATMFVFFFQSLIPSVFVFLLLAYGLEWLFRWHWVYYAALVFGVIGAWQAATEKLDALELEEFKKASRKVSNRMLS